MLLHVVGFGIFIAFVVPGHYKGLGIGVSVLAYTLGLRHAFDADHISAIDNTTRKLMNERREIEGSKRPLSVGYFFSLGHSTIVIAIGAGLIIAEKAVYGAVSHNSSGLEQFGGSSEPSSRRHSSTSSPCSTSSSSPGSSRCSGRCATASTTRRSSSGS